MIDICLYKYYNNNNKYMYIKVRNHAVLSIWLNHRRTLSISRDMEKECPPSSQCDSALTLQVVASSPNDVIDHVFPVCVTGLERRSAFSERKEVSGVPLSAVMLSLVSWSVFSRTVREFCSSSTPPDNKVEYTEVPRYITRAVFYISSSSLYFAKK